MICKKITSNPNKLLSGDEIDVLITSREKDSDSSDNDLAYPLN